MELGAALISARITVLSSIAAVLATGCGTSNGPDSLQNRLAPATNLAPVDCGACKPEWERAQLWLAKHSKLKNQLVSDLVLRTKDPSSLGASYGFTVTKEPVAGSSGGYRIVLTPECGSPVIACEPTPADVQRAFYHYLVTGTDLLEGRTDLRGLR